MDHTAVAAACMNGANPSLDIAASGHAYSIVAIDTVNQTVSFRNPWYSGTVLKTLSYANFCTYFQRIDYVDLSSNNQYLLATNNGDTLTSGVGNDMLYGGTGSDSLSGLTGNDVLYGYAGNDFLNGGANDDTMYGGLGDDILCVNTVGDVVVENYNEGIDTVNTSISYTLGSNVENMRLTGAENLNGTGNTLNNILTGNLGNNTLSGLGGNDTYVINQTGGRDVIVDSSGTNDILSFGSGILKQDIALFASGTSLVLDYKNGNQVTIQNQVNGASAIEKIQLSDNSYISNNIINTLIQQMAAYATGNGIQLTSADAVRSDNYLNNLVMSAWQTA